MYGVGFGYGAIGATTKRSGGASFSYLLDTYSGASVAYSLRKLSSTYSGSCIRVRRSSDNAEQNIGFVSNILDTASLLTFVGSGSGFVTTWYDQSGNSVNMTQAVGGTQPIIVSSGSLISIGGQPIINFHQKQMENNMSNNYTQSLFTAYQNETTGNMSSWVAPFGSVTGLYYTGAVAQGNMTSPTQYGVSATFFINNTISVTTRDGMYTNTVTGTKKLFNYFNDGANVSGRYVQYPNTGYIGNFKVFEAIIYPTDKTSIKTDINTNINTFYGIY